MSTKQFRPLFLLREQEFTKRRLRSAFLRIAQPLPARPAPRHHWDNVARAANPANAPGTDAVDRCRDAMAAAIATGNQQVIAETTHAIEAFYDEMKSASLVATLEHEAPAGGDCMLALVRESNEAVTAVVVADRARCESSIEAAIREMNDVVVALQRHGKTLTTRLWKPVTNLRAMH